MVDHRTARNPVRHVGNRCDPAGTAPPPSRWMNSALRPVPDVRDVSGELQFRTVHGYRRAFRIAGAGPPRCC